MANTVNAHFLSESTLWSIPPVFGASGNNHSVGYVPDPGATAGNTRVLCENSTWITIPSSNGGGGGNTVSDFFNVKIYGATGDGVTNDTVAVNNAIQAIANAGGGILYFPQGKFLCDGLFIPSNCVVMGSGIDSTVIMNTGGTNDETFILAGTMTGNNWPVDNITYTINTPTNYSSQVTMTTASQANNFAPGDFIMLSGGLQGTSFWFPSWWTSVVSVNATSGVITLAEPIPFEGVLLNTVQRIESFAENVTVRDMTLVAGLDACFSCFVARNILVENVCFRPWLEGGSPAGPYSSAVATIGQARFSGFRNCISYGWGFELFGSAQCFMDSCQVYLGQQNFDGTPGPAGALLVDGGCTDCTLINNYLVSIIAGNLIAVLNSPVRIKIIGNSIIGVQNGGYAGINMTDNSNSDPSVSDQNNRNIVMGNSIVGAGTPETNEGITMTSGVCIGNIIENVALGITGTSTSDMFLDDNVFVNVTAQGRFSNPEGDLQGGNNFWRERQSIGTKQLASGNATPAVNGGGDFVISQTSAQNITDFTGGLPGDEVLIYFYDNLTTLVNGSLNLVGGSNVTPAAGTILKFKMIDIGGGNVWFQVP